MTTHVLLVLDPISARLVWSHSPHLPYAYIIIIIS